MLESTTERVITRAWTFGLFGPGSGDNLYGPPMAVLASYLSGIFQG